MSGQELSIEELRSKLHTSRILQDIKVEFLAIENDMNEQELFSRAKYREKLLEIKNRLDKTGRPLVDAKQISYDIPDMIDAPDMINALTGIQREMAALGRTVEVIDESLKSVSPVTSFLANAISIAMIPWQCYRENRKPNREEAIKLGFCAVAVVLIVVAHAVGVGFVGSVALAITAATISLAGVWLNNRIKIKKMNRLKESALTLKQEIKELILKTNELQDKRALTKDENQLLDESIQQLRKTTDKYIIYGYAINNIRNELASSDVTKLRQFNAVTGGAFLVGTIALISSAIVGSWIMIGASIASFSAMLVFKIKQKIVNKKNKQKISPERAKFLQEGDTPQSPNEIRYVEIIKEQQSINQALAKQAYHTKKLELQGILQNIATDRAIEIQQGALPITSNEERFISISKECERLKILAGVRDEPQWVEQSEAPTTHAPEAAPKPEATTREKFKLKPAVNSESGTDLASELNTISDSESESENPPKV